MEDAGTRNQHESGELMRLVFYLGRLARMLAIVAVGSAAMTFVGGGAALAGGPPAPPAPVGSAPPPHPPAPGGAVHQPVPGATRAGTGKPLLGEGILAGTLLLAGTGGIAYVRRRRTAPSR